MENKQEDRRSRRSRKLLKQGLLELMKEKRFAAISVRDVTDRMDLNRGTFYLHYPDTAALLRSLEEDMLGEARTLVDAHMAETAETGTLQPVFEPVLNYVVDNRDVCAALLDNDSGSSFAARLHDLIRHYGARLVETWYPGAPREKLDYLLSFIAYGLIGLVKVWFEDEMRLPKEDLIAEADRMVTGAATACWGQRHKKTAARSGGGQPVDKPEM